MQMVSVIIPIYNSEKTIVKCLKSIMNQTYKNIEILVINNGSTDNSTKITSELMENDERIKLINTEKKGVSLARNIGLSEAKGDWIMFVDADDWIDESAINDMITIAIQEKVDIVKCAYKMIYSPKKVNVISYKEKKENIDSLFWKVFFKTYNYNQVWGQLISSHIAKKCKFDENLIMAEDYKYNYELYKKINYIYVLQKPFYNYSVNQNGINYSTNREKILYKLSNIIDVCEFIWKIEEKNRDEIEIRTIKETNSHIIDYISLKDSKIEELDKYIYRDYYWHCLKKIKYSRLGKYGIIAFLLKNKRMILLKIISKCLRIKR